MFAFGMGKLLKYLFPFIVALAFINGTETDILSDCTDTNYGLHIESDAVTTSLSAPETEIFLPRQAFSANPLRTQSNSRRPDGSYRHNFKFIKSGKVIDSGIRLIVQKQSSVNHASISEPGHILTSLCRLII